MCTEFACIGSSLSLTFAGSSVAFFFFFSLFLARSLHSSHLTQAKFPTLRRRSVLTSGEQRRRKKKKKKKNKKACDEGRASVSLSCVRSSADRVVCCSGFLFEREVCVRVCVKWMMRCVCVRLRQGDENANVSCSERGSCGGCGVLEDLGAWRFF